ncbi:MAG: dihydrolipoyl dehydrogenase [Dysgonomonas sp.]
MTYDVAVIGGGPAGYTAAERAAANGLTTILFEKNTIGGVCLNEGCIPTKTLLYSAKTLDNIKSAPKYGITTEGNFGFDLGKIIARKNKIVKKLTAGIRMRLAEHNVAIITGTATIKGEENGKIKIESGENTFLAKKVILCTGSETMIPPIKGLSETNYWTSKEALENKELPESLVIIGGGVIGMEFASFFNSLGVKVDVVEMMPEILGAMDKECSAMLRNEYEKKGVTFHLSTKVTEVSDDHVIIEKDGESSEISCEKILLSVGRKPIITGVGLETFGIELHKKGVKVNQNMQTSHPNIYACGDITGFSLLAHTAIREAEVAVNHISDIDDSMSYKAVPAVVYTNPEIAGVGRTEEELREKNISYNVLKLPMTYSGRFVAENELGNGICKLITDKGNILIGCHIIGNPASEIISIASMAIEKGYSADEFKKIIFPHPSVSEIFHECLYSK